MQLTELLVGQKNICVIEKGQVGDDTRLGNSKIRLGILEFA